MMDKKISFFLVIIAAITFALPLVSRAGAGTTTRVSVATDGSEANGPSDGPALSDDGRYVAFKSFASNLVSGDSNGYWDVFVYDRQSGALTRVSLATGGAQGNENVTGPPTISGDGQTVAFSSWASNLIADDTNGEADIFVHHRQSGTTRRVSVSSDGSQANGSSGFPVISADGRFVAFASFASNLVSPDTNDAQDVFLHDLQTGITSRISVAADGSEANQLSSPGLAISAGGRYVAFVSGATNLVSGDTNGYSDVFVRDTELGTTTRISVASDGTQPNNDAGSPAISGDGRYVAFRSYATNLVSGDTNAHYDIFLRDTQTGVTSRVSVSSDGTQGTGGSHSPAITPDGRFVAFSSTASNLAGADSNGQSDIFVHDTQTGDTILTSPATDGTQGNGPSYDPALASGGGIIAFESEATNLVADDTNRAGDVFVRVEGAPPPPAPPGENATFLPLVVRSGGPG